MNSIALYTVHSLSSVFNLSGIQIFPRKIIRECRLSKLVQLCLRASIMVTQLCSPTEVAILSRHLGSNPRCTYTIFLNTNSYNCLNKSRTQQWAFFQEVFITLLCAKISGPVSKLFTIILGPFFSFVILPLKRNPSLVLHHFMMKFYQYLRLPSLKSLQKILKHSTIYQRKLKFCTPWFEIWKF